MNLQFLGLALPEKTENMSILVGGFNPSENMKVSWDYYSLYMEK